MNLKKLLTATMMISFAVFYSNAQDISYRQLKDSIIKSINESRQTEFSSIERRILSSDSTIRSLDYQILSLRQDRDKIENLISRVIELEKRQAAINDRELTVFSFNLKRRLF